NRAAVGRAGRAAAAADGRHPLLLLPARDGAEQARGALARGWYPRRKRHLDRERHPEGSRHARGGAGRDRDPRGARARHARGAGKDRSAARRRGRHHDDSRRRRTRMNASKEGAAPLRAPPADCAGEAGARKDLRTAWPGIIERYRRYLPVTDKTPVVTLLEGNTPLLPA